MSPLFRKLNHRGQPVLHILNAPESFAPETAALDADVRREVTSPVHFALAFVLSKAEVDQAAARLTAAAEGDAILWFAYPKGTSKRYRCDFDRDRGWDLLGQAGWEAVRQVAIDEDWSALRFRRVSFIAKLTRDPKRAASAEGKRRTTGRATR